MLVAAPIGDGTRAQLNIYEQVTDRRPCFAVSGASPARVDPLLGTFDFTGICTRYIDANGYSLRVGENDLATVYRISVVRSGNDNILLATPHRGKTGPEMILARTNGQAAGFLQFTPEPGWRLKRRHFGTRDLGHVYIYRDNWPGEATAAPAGSGAPGGTAPASAPSGSNAPGSSVPASAAPGTPAPSTTPRSPAPAGRGAPETTTPQLTTPQLTTPAANPTAAPAVPGSSAPRSTTPGTPAPRTAVPGSTAPGTTAPATAAPSTTTPQPSSPAGVAAPTGSAPAAGAARTAAPLSAPPVVPPASTTAPSPR